MCMYIYNNNTDVFVCGQTSAGGYSWILCHVVYLHGALHEWYTTYVSSGARVFYGGAGSGAVTGVSVWRAGRTEGISTGYRWEGEKKMRGEIAYVYRIL